MGSEMCIRDSPLVENADIELQRIKEEQDELMQRDEKAMFGGE